MWNMKYLVNQQLWGSVVQYPDFWHITAIADSTNTVIVYEDNIISE